MFISNMIDSIKMMIRARDILLWLVFFPIILATVFYFAFGHLTQTNVFIKADIAVVNLESNTIFSQVLKEVSNSDDVADENDLFNVIKSSEEEGRSLILDGEIDALLIVNGTDIKFIYSGMNLENTVVKTFLDNYLSNAKTFENILTISPQNAASLANDLRNEVEITSRQISKNALNKTTTYFYALFGMVIFFFSIAGMEVIKLTQPNKSATAARQSLSPTSRKKIFLAQYTGMFICSVFIIILMLFYVGIVLGIPLGNIGFVFSACIIGTLASMGFGMVVGTIPVKNQNVKDILLIILTLALSLINGLMGSGIKEAVTNNAPFINYINPIALISDSFHSLYYYDGLREFLIRIGLLGAYAVLFTGATLLLIRRKKHAYI